MKVLIINEVCGIGSTGRICTDIAEALEKKGYEVKIAYGRGGNVQESFKKYAVRIGNNIDVICHALTSRLLDGAGFGSGHVTKRFISWIRKYDPDVIHLHNLHGYYLHIGILFEYLKKCEKKIIWTLHDCWAFTGHSAYCDSVQCEKWMYGCGDCPILYSYPKAYIDRSRQNWIKKKHLFTGIKSMSIIVPSHWLAGLVKKSFLKEYAISVIHNGIDTSKFYPMKNDYKKQYGLSGKKIILSVATVWNNLKGYDDFLKLAEMLSDDFIIILVGGMKKQLVKKLPSNIVHIKKTKDIQEMAILYNASDVYLNLTYCDTYPTVNLEAVACGTPVISYSVGGSKESAEKFGGKTVERGDLKSVINILNNLNELSVRIEDISILDKDHAIEAYMTFYS